MRGGEGMSNVIGELEGHNKKERESREREGVGGKRRYVGRVGVLS